MTAKQFQARFGRLEDTMPVGVVGGPKPQIRIPKAPAPNKTEEAWIEYVRRKYPEADVRYEPLTLRLPSGTKYTPDVIVFDAAGAVMEVYEVKGAHIHNAASIRAFKEARSAFPFWPFKFAQLTKQGWAIA